MGDEVLADDVPASPRTRPLTPVIEGQTPSHFCCSGKHKDCTWPDTCTCRCHIEAVAPSAETSVPEYTEDEAFRLGQAIGKHEADDLLTVAKEVYDEFLNGRIYQDHDESTALLGRFADAIKVADNPETAT